MNVAASSTRSSVGVRDLKNHLSAFLDRARSGEEITVTEHGRPIAKLTAVSDDLDRFTTLVEAGVITPAPNPKRRLPTRRVAIEGGAPTIAVLVAEQRR